jgi:hypothetical protein
VPGIDCLTLTTHPVKRMMLDEETDIILKIVYGSKPY